MKFKKGDLIKYIPLYLPWNDRDVEYVSDLTIFGNRIYLKVNGSSNYLINNCELITSILREEP